MSSVYHINRGINQPLEFRGLIGQYIWMLGAGILGLLVLFAVLYIVGVSMRVCIVIVFGLGIGLFISVRNMSKQYGEHGLMKKLASKKIPKKIKCK